MKISAKIYIFRRMWVAFAMLFATLWASAQGRDTVKIVFIGDVMAHKPQTNIALKAGCDSTIASSYDYSSYFKHVKNRFDSADFVVANMETPLGRPPYTGYPTFSAPASLAWEAADSGIDLFLCANNHICDKGKSGIDSTSAVYRRMNADFTGFYTSLKEEVQKSPFITIIGDIRVAFINFTYGVNGHKIPEGYHVNLMDSTNVKMNILRAKALGAEYIIATPHWGEEYHLDISEEQKRWTEMLYRWGVHAIVGTHPHVVQKTEYDGRRATAYSLGNFISNMSIVNGQIGMLYTLRLVRDDDRSVRIVIPRVEYLWCARRGKLEENYTVVPILEYLEREEEFISKEEYNKMKREWEALKKKFDL